jgi:hypothetical protein
MVRRFMKGEIVFLLLILGTVVGLNAVYTGDSAAQSQTSEKWLAVTVCDLVKDRSYDGAHVMLHAKVLDGELHGILLKDDRCSKGLRMTASDSVRDQEDYNEFMRTVYSLRKTTLNHVIAAEFYGRFVYRPAEPRLKWALAVERISNVEVK